MIPLLGFIPNSFCFKSIQKANTKYKMNEIVNKLLLVGDKFMTQMHLRQPAFMYSACGKFTKSKERIQTLKEAGHGRYTYQTELDKDYFQYNIKETQI